MAEQNGDGFARAVSEEELDAGQAELLRLYPIPEARASNCIPALTLGQARVVAHRGQRYVLERLRFVDGLALHGLFTELRRRMASADPADGGDVVPALTLARAVVAQLGLLLRPDTGWRRWAHRVVPSVMSDLVRNPFADATWPELHDLVGRVLEVPDEMPRALPEPGERAATTDWTDQLAAFAHAFPAWTQPDGYPRSWAHFIAGTVHLGRQNARQILADMRAANLARAAAHGAQIEPTVEKLRLLGGMAA